MAEMLYFTPGGARITGPPPTSGNFLSRRADDPRALINAVNTSRLPSDYRAQAQAAQQRRDSQRISAMPWYGRDLAARLGTTDDALQQAYGQLSDVDKVRSRYLGPTWMLQQIGSRDQPAPGSGFGGASPRDPVPAPTTSASPFSPAYDPLPPPAVLPPEDPPVFPAPPPTSWVAPSAAPPIAAPSTAPPIAAPPPTATPPPVPPGPPSQIPAEAAPTSPTAAQSGAGPGPYPPFLGGQATWGNPTDPYLLPFSPGSILSPGRGGNPPAWWGEIMQPQQIAPPRWPTGYQNPYLGNAGGFNVGSPYFAPMSSWGFYPMPHMSQHMPGSFGMVTPGMGSWFTGSPAGFNPAPNVTTTQRNPFSFAPNPVQANLPTAQNTPQGFGTQTGYGATPNMAGSMQTSMRPSWMTSGMFLG